MANKLESLLRDAGRKLADYQVCRFYKIPEELVQTPCDFIGFTVKGRAILIEAKMVSSPSLKIAGNPGLSAHQWNELMDAHKAGAIALVCWARAGIVKTFDMGYAEQLSRGRKSIPWDAVCCRTHRLTDAGNAHLDFLEPYLDRGRMKLLDIITN